jgi:hypothetical protein
MLTIKAPGSSHEQLLSGRMWEPKDLALGFDSSRTSPAGGC